MARDAPHWLRVGLASLQKGGKSWRLWEKRREVRGRGCSLLSLRRQGFLLHLGRAEYPKISHLLKEGTDLPGPPSKEGWLSSHPWGIIVLSGYGVPLFWWGQIHQYPIKNKDYGGFLQLKFPPKPFYLEAIFLLLLL